MKLSLTLAIRGKNRKIVTEIGAHLPSNGAWNVAIVAIAKD